MRRRGVWEIIFMQGEVIKGLTQRRRVLRDLILGNA